MKSAAKIATAALVLAATVPAVASSASVIWLNITPGARSNGMGEAFVAVADDATASYWNPAGLAFVERKNEIHFQHSPWLRQLADDLYFEYLGYAGQLEGWGGVGGNITFMSMGEQTETEAGNPDPVGTFYAYGLAFTGSFGTEVAPGVGVGLGVKYIYDHLYYGDEGKGSSFAADAGVLYRLPMEDLGLEDYGEFSVGAALSNLGPNMSYGGESEGNPLPRTVRAGLAYTPFNEQLSRLRIAADYSKLLTNVDDGLSTEFSENKWGAGAEYWYYDLIGLRLGYSHDTEGESTISGATFGAGIRYSNFQLDMAFIPVESSLESQGKYNQKYSLSVAF